MKAFKNTIQAAFLLAITLLSTVSLAQQQGMFTQYMFNGLAINPAYAGSHETLSLTALTRYQWVGIDGAPNTQSFSAHAPIKKEQIALGLQLFNDDIGVSKTFNMFAAAAYRINFDKTTLSLGLQLGFSSYKSNVSTLNPIWDNNDIALSEDVREPFKPNMGTGAYYYGDRFYLGLSLPTLFNATINSFEIEDTGLTYESGTSRRHVFLTGGYVFDLGHHFKLKPSGLIKYVAGAPIQMDINLNLLIDEVIWVGTSYRSGESLDFLLELQLTSSLRFGYAYDYILNDINMISSGSHELMLNYRIEFKKDRVTSPRYF
ncbi:type IX secretion system membrane protein PorP/SprF [Reichenbachiella carrageenanivorans]|uniref:Type IX secretion system membrane protein PorP/SprF n=1 Tax=Reichenbachiella carrageenanivorans TaxID=2979869 RepID=A0ABY6D1J0_9BACT|nr:type IX secretion system membrane protein PorP/SprF [Reichenbachiella carrageenanivorans]UXX78948.1 type IX secretion system membrane protein PorP/SprF [Reichenbachiella carrageenanivorans]